MFRILVIFKFLLKFYLIFILKLGLLCDLLWADPEENSEGWGKSDRGISKTFSKKILREYLGKFDMDCVVRGHQVIIYFKLN